MALDLGELHATIDADDKSITRAIDRTKRNFDGLDKTVTRKVADINDEFSKVGDGIDKSSKKGLGRFGRGLDMVTDKTSGFGRAMNAVGTVGLVASIGSLIPLVLGLGAALAPAAGALLALPAAAAAAKIAMATLSMALQNVGDALGASLTGDAKAFEAALEKLPPTARGVVKNIGGAFFGLQRTVQSAFFAPMRSEAEKFGEVMKGPLKAGFSGVATALGGVGAKILEFATSVQSIEVLKGLFAGVRDAIDGAAFGVPPLLQGIRDLIGVFVPGLGDAGSAIGSAMSRWGQWMSQIAASGQASVWFENAKTVFSQLWDIGGNVLDIVTGIFAAGDGGAGLLGTIEKITAAMGEWVNSAEGQEQLAAVFSILSQTGSNLAVILPAVATILGGIASVLTSLPGPVQNVVTGLLAFAAAWKLLGIQSLINGARMAAAWVMGMGPVGWIIAAVVALVALIILYWDEIVVFLEEAWQYIKDTAVDIWNGILAFFEEWGPLLLAILTGGISLLVDLIVTHWDDIKAWTVSIWNSIVDFFVGIWDGLVAIVQGGVQKVLDFITWLKQIPVKAKVWFQQMKDGAVAKFRALIDWAKSLPGKVLSALGKVGSKLLQAGKDLLNGLLNGLKEKASDLWDWLKGLLSGFKDEVKKFFGISSPSKLMAYYGRMIGTGLADGVKGTTGLVEQAGAALNEAIALPDADVALSASTRSMQTTRLSDADRNLLRRATEGPNEMLATIPVDLGEGINQTVQVKMQRQNRQLTRGARAGAGAGL